MGKMFPLHISLACQKVRTKEVQALQERVRQRILQKIAEAKKTEKITSSPEAATQPQK